MLLGVTINVGGRIDIRLFVSSFVDEDPQPHGTETLPIAPQLNLLNRVSVADHGEELISNQPHDDVT